MDKKISVIIPVYNTSKYIEKCLNSIVNQTMESIEIVIVNDGSTDNSEEIIQKWINENQHKKTIKYFKKENGGLSAARNFGVKQATGEYITFVDSDDYLDEKIYENLEKYMNQKIELIKFKMSTVDENDQLIEKLDGPVFEKCSGTDAFKRLYSIDTFMEVSCIYLYKKDFYEKNKFEFEIETYHEDFGLIPWILINAKSVVSTEYFGYYYLKRENSITDATQPGKEKKKAYDILKHYDNAISRITNSSFNTDEKDIFKRYYTNVLLLKIENLYGYEKRKFIKEIKTRKVYKNIKPENPKQLIKRILLRLNIKLYLKLR